MKKLALAFVLAAAAAAPAAEEELLSVWRMPQVWPRHMQLREQLVGAIKRGDGARMEEICREALHIIPGDATWHYNLACALSLRGKSADALDELEKAIKFGFRNADAISKDSDFSRIRENPRFAELVEEARALKGKPVPGQPEKRLAYVQPNGTLVLDDTNVAWNFDAGVFEAYFRVTEPDPPIAEQTDAFRKSEPNEPDRPYVREWIADGTGASNLGDVYVNRDLGHSPLTVSDFPGIVNVKSCPAAHAAQADVNHPNTLFPNCAVFGNISRARTKGPFWRSFGRLSLTDNNLTPRMHLLYRNNQFWVIPAHEDYGKKDIGDAFPGVAPFQFLSVGSSWSDQGFLRLALSASASFPKETKQAIIRRHLMGPTLQWLLRRTQKGVETEDDYLSSKAHPTAFAWARMDPVRAVEKAHALRPEQIPPFAALAAINSRTHPLHYPVPGRDYPDAASEFLYNTPSAICLVLRAPDGIRSFQFRALAEGIPQSATATFAWRVVHGDASAVKFETIPGETANTPEKGFVQITVDRRDIKERIDVACFAKTDDTDWGAPSFISFYPIPRETRVYRRDGKIASIDYSNQEGSYTDPFVSLPRHWKDTYSYDDDGRLLGWTRSYNGKDTTAFTAAGDRIVERHADGTPAKAVHVKYVPRSSNDALEPLTLTYLDDGEPFDVK